MIAAWIVLATGLLGRGAPTGALPLSSFQETDTAYICSVSSPTAFPGDTVYARAYVPADTARTFTYQWSTSSGQVEAQGDSARWVLRGIPLGTYTISATITDPHGQRRSCSAQVQVVPATGRDGRLTGRALLVRRRNERQGYGLYSYLLMDAPPDPENRARYVAVLHQMLRLTSDIAALEQVPVARHQLNVGYIPVTRSSIRLTADSLLATYDYARAQALLSRIPGERRHGIFLVATQTPLSQPQRGPLLVQDLTSVPERLAPLWVNEFLNQTAQERFWDARALHGMALRVRTIISVLGQGLPEVQSGIDTWWKWLPDTATNRESR
jgi:hypothetical protein